MRINYLDNQNFISDSLPHIPFASTANSRQNHSQKLPMLWMSDINPLEQVCKSILSSTYFSEQTKAQKAWPQSESEGTCNEVTLQLEGGHADEFLIDQNIVPQTKNVDFMDNPQWSAVNLVNYQ